MMTKHRDSLWHLAAIGCLACALPACARPVAVTGNANNETDGEVLKATVSQLPDDNQVADDFQVSSAEKVGPKPVDLVFMYKGITKFVTPEDQDEVLELFQSAEALGPDGAWLLLEGIDRLVPNGPEFDYDAIMWCNEDNEFATIDVAAEPGKVPEDWAGLITEPFEFPPDATWLAGQSGDLAWFGSIPLDVRVDKTGDPDKIIAAGVRGYRQIVEGTRNPIRFLRDYHPPDAGPMNDNTVKPLDPDGNSLRDLSWQSEDHQRWFRMIGTWPFGMDDVPQGEWLFVTSWPGVRNRMMWMTHVWIFQLPAEGYLLPQDLNDLFSIYSMFHPLRHYGVLDLAAGDMEFVYPDQ